MDKKKTTPARLDADRTAKPKTRIVHHPNPGHCVGPGSRLKRPEYETEEGERIPLTPPPVVKPTPPTWQDVLGCKKHYGIIQFIANAAATANYPYFEWNGRVYSVDEDANYAETPWLTTEVR